VLDLVCDVLDADSTRIEVRPVVPFATPADREARLSSLSPRNAADLLVQQVPGVKGPGFEARPVQSPGTVRALAEHEGGRCNVFRSETDDDYGGRR
jgi:hypothetical protein